MRKRASRLLPLLVALGVLAIAAPPALAAGGQVDVDISNNPTNGMAETNGTWAPDGTADPANLNIFDLDDSASSGNVVVSTASTGTSGTDTGNIDIQDDPNDPTGDVEFSPGSGGSTLIDTGTITLDEQQYDGPVQLNQDATFDSTTSTTFDSTVDGANDLTLEGPTTFDAPVGGTTPLTTLTAEESVNLSETGAEITTTGAQDYQADVELDYGEGYLSSTGAGNITFESTVTTGDETSYLTIATDGTTTFDDSVSGYLTSLTVEGHSGGGSGNTVINTASIAIANGGTTTFENPVTLNKDLDVSEVGTEGGGYLYFESTLDSVTGTSHSLTDTIGDSVSLGTVGGTTPLSSVDIADPTFTGNVYTTGAQTYGSGFTFGTPTLSSSGGGAISFSKAVSGYSQDSLTTDTTGNTSIEDGAQAMSSTGLASLEIDGPASLSGTIHTVGDQTYGGPVTLGAAAELLSDSGLVKAESTVGLGNYNLTVDGDGDLVGAISGDGSLDLGSQQDSASAPAETVELEGDNDQMLGETTIDGTNSLLEFTGSDNFGTGGLSIADGGGIEWAAGNTADISNLLPPIGPGGTVFDTNGNDVTFNTPLTGAATGQSGTITKAGAGELTLTGDNTLDEPWDVTGGTLGLTGTLAGKATVGSSGALACDGGTLSGGLTNDGGTLSSVPDAPTTVTATAGTGRATVSFTPGATRCSPFVGYTVTAEPGNVQATGTGSPITVTGLRGGTTYTFTVTATNVIGTSAASATSNAVTTSRSVYATIASPATGNTYTVGQKVTTTFSCAALVSGALSSCRDSNGATNGSGLLNTSKAGHFTYVVTATGSDDSISTASIAYTVVLPSNQFTLSGITTKAKGVVTFSVKVPDAGVLSVSEAAGKTRLASAKLKSKGATTFHVRLTLTAKERKKLGKHGLKATLTLTFTPTGGEAKTVKHSGVRLKR